MHTKCLDKNNERIEELELILNNVNDGFITLDADYIFTYANKSFESICGQCCKTAIGKSYWEYFPLSKDLKFWTEYRKAFDEQKDTQFEAYSNAMNKWVSVSVYPTSNGFSIYFMDISTERAASKLIEAQNKRLIEIAHVQSHKVRKPLASLLGLAPFLNCDDSNKEIVQGIIKCCLELDEVIREINGKTYGLNMLNESRA